ncbi:hypothetical protein NFK49_23890 (plasmid) [Escherichia coli]|nr:hypothetical protein NFK49_23890 [Escherichia coli]
MPQRPAGTEVAVALKIGGAA